MHELRIVMLLHFAFIVPFSSLCFFPSHFSRLHLLSPAPLERDEAVPASHFAPLPMALLPQGGLPTHLRAWAQVCVAKPSPAFLRSGAALPSPPPSPPLAAPVGSAPRAVGTRRAPGRICRATVHLRAASCVVELPNAFRPNLCSGSPVAQGFGGLHFMLVYSARTASSPPRTGYLPLGSGK